MHHRISIINVPLLACMTASVAIHVGALYCKGIYSPPAPSMEQGRTVVHLTLVPALPSQAAEPEREPEPQPEKPPEQSIDAQVEPSLRPADPAALSAAIPSDPVPPQQTAAEAVSSPSPDQDASLLEDKGVIAEAQPVKTVEPNYPRLSRRRGEEGTVTLSIEVLQDGTPGKITILKSSSHKRLDEAAMKAAQQTTFSPAKQFGRIIDSAIELSFTFRLTDD